MVAERFQALPSVVARDLDEDSELLSLECITLLEYAAAKRALDRAQGEKELEHWKGSRVMGAVERNTFDLHRERIARRMG